MVCFSGLAQDAVVGVDVVAVVQVEARQPKQQVGPRGVAE
jgi:hypothetical protein